jgi:UDP-galactopyranose mutase
MAAVDYLIVGSGLTGSVIARTLADAGRSVLVLERREHLGGNLHDFTHPSGIRIHRYGPHYFRTSSEQVWQFVNRFATFDRYEAVVKSYVDGHYENWPIAASYIRQVVGEGWQPEYRGVPRNFEEASLAMMPRLVYEKFVKGYTEKQWGAPANSLSPNLATRFDVRHDDEPRLVRHKYQGIPSDGYSNLMANLLAGIPLVLNCDYMQARHTFSPSLMTIFTGSIDEFFAYDLGRLAYRSQQRQHAYLADVDYALPCGQVNNPNPNHGAHIRTLEWKHMMPRHLAAEVRGTVLTRETPVSPSDPNHYEYPFPDRHNTALYEAYRQRAAALPDVLICGRLGEYRYYDMDQAIGRALVLAQRILHNQAPLPALAVTAAAGGQ